MYQTLQMFNVVGVFSRLIFLSEHDCGIIKELLDASFVLYQSSHIMSGTKQVLMMFFANLAFSENLSLSR